MNFITSFLIPKVNIPIISINSCYKNNNLHLDWEKINYNQVINLKHFDNILNKDNDILTKDQILEYNLLKIDGLPTLIIVIDKSNNKNVVKEFIFNKSFILMIDAGSIIRKSFYDKFKNINLNDAINKDIFMII
jgi:hypothetical protein